MLSESASPSKKAIAIALLTILLLYRPFPAQLTQTTYDRVAGRIIELGSRAKWCPTAQCWLQWTRASVSALHWTGHPLFDYDSQLAMETTHWDGVKVRVYHPHNPSSAESDGAIIFMHGGGFTIGNIQMYESLTRTLAKMTRTRLFVSIDYRLAPETIFPGALEDCERVLEHVIAHGPEDYDINPNKIIVMGDSAGANLATVIAQRRRARNAQPKILGQASGEILQYLECETQVLLYPLLQFSNLHTHSYRYSTRELDGLAFVDRRAVVLCYLWYAGVDVHAHPEFAAAAAKNGHVSDDARTMLQQEFMSPLLTNPDFAPLMQSNLSDLPSSLIVTCEFDVLRDEGAVYAQRLKHAGVPTQWTHYAHGFHGMLNLYNELTIARNAINDISEWTTNLLRES